jgi:hypothetical protein
MSDNLGGFKHYYSQLSREGHKEFFSFSPETSCQYGSTDRAAIKGDYPTGKNHHASVG